MTARPVISRIPSVTHQLRTPRPTPSLSSHSLARSLCLPPPRRPVSAWGRSGPVFDKVARFVPSTRSYLTKTREGHDHDDLVRIAKGLIGQRERSVLGDLNATPRETETVRSEIGALGKLVDDLQLAIKILRETEKLAANDPDEEMRALATSDLPDLVSASDEAASNLRASLLDYRPSPNTALNLAPIIIDFSEGEGGPDSALWNSNLLKIYEKEFLRQGWKWKIVDERRKAVTGGPEVGLSECSVEVWDPKAGKKGDGEIGVFGRFKWETGVHRLQKVSDADRLKRKMTSASVVYVLPTGPLVESDSSEEEVLDWNDIRIDLMRASGPGGQHVNKTESAVRLVHIPTNLTVLCQEGRSQPENKAQAYKILRSRLLDVRRRERADAVLALRKSSIRGTSKSDRIRTYNYYQDRVTDHRIGLTVGLQSVEPGGIGLETIHAQLEEQDEEDRLKDLRDDLEAEE